MASPVPFPVLSRSTVTSSLADAEARGIPVVRFTGSWSIPEALALVRNRFPVAEDGVKGWALAVPAGTAVPCRASVRIATKAGPVEAGDLLLLNYAWKTAGGRVVLRCAASATPDGRRDVIFPVDFYEEQLGSVAGVAGVPLRFPGWEAVRHEPGAFLPDAAPGIVPGA